MAGSYDGVMMLKDSVCDLCVIVSLFKFMHWKCGLNLYREGNEVVVFEKE